MGWRQWSGWWRGRGPLALLWLRLCGRWAVGGVYLVVAGAALAQPGCVEAVAALAAEPASVGEAETVPPPAWPLIGQGDCQAAALSADGQWLAVGVRPRPSPPPSGPAAAPQLHLYRTQPLAWVATHPAAQLNRRAASAVARIVPAPGRRSWVVALQDLPELWEVGLNEQAEPIFDGWVHDYRMAEAIATPGFLGVRRTPLAQPVRLLVLDGPGTHAFVVADVPGESARRVDVINLDVRRAVGSLPVPAGAHTQPSEPMAPCHGTPVVRLGVLANGLPWVVQAQRPWAELESCGHAEPQ